MRTRNQAKRRHQSSGEEDLVKPPFNAERKTSAVAINDSGTLNDVSLNAVVELPKRVKSRSLREINKEDVGLQQCNSIAKSKSGLEEIGKQVVDSSVRMNSVVPEGCAKDVVGNCPSELKVGGNAKHDNTDCKDNELDWEDGPSFAWNSVNNHQEDTRRGVTVEFDVLPDSAKRKPIHRASAEDKELAELVHKVHLLCLLGRGRLIDSACNDPLIQASLLSLLPAHLLKILEAPKLTASALAPIASWFHSNFHIGSPNATEGSFHSALATALETREGTPEEVAALSVALFRAMNLTTRFVSILDAASLKPDAEKFESISPNAGREEKGIFNSSTLMVAKRYQGSLAPPKQSISHDGENVCETSLTGALKTYSGVPAPKFSQCNDCSSNDQLNDGLLDSVAHEAQNDTSDICLANKSRGSKRKGDLEFEMELEMALSATAVGSSKSSIGPDVNVSCNDSPNLSCLKRMKKITSEESLTSSHGISTAIGSKKIGAPLYWAEVYCSGENMAGKWVHVDAVNAIVDEEQKVEAAATACKTSLRYVVAFAGHGAKDVTRRYCMKWYKIASQRISSIWWDAVLAPLMELESGSTGGLVHLKEETPTECENMELLNSADHPAREYLTDPVNPQRNLDIEVQKGHVQEKLAETFPGNPFVATRSSLEDMELEIRALTEPLPTNQQAYRSHQLYAIEKWLTKYQTLYPKGPVLGFCSGHAVYPRTCVQTLHTKKKWMCEGLQVKSGELPAKVLRRPTKLRKEQFCDHDDQDDEFLEGTVELYGKWQTVPLCLPHAVDGIVPKNERGQVDVWSEKCLPPGTVHIRLPSVALVAKRLELDFAPAMVGFESRNGRFVPIFDGIVVCAEFKDSILAAYAEEAERREAEEKKRKEAQALSRWYQLLSSIVTRQILNSRYGDGAPSPSESSIFVHKADNKCRGTTNDEEGNWQTPACQQRNVENDTVGAPLLVVTEAHEHVFLADDQTFDEESLTRTKRCRCGFSIQVEEL